MKRRTLSLCCLGLIALLLSTAVGDAVPRTQPRDPSVVSLKTWGAANKELIGKKLFEVLRPYRAGMIVVLLNCSSVKDATHVKRARALWASDAKLEGTPDWGKYEAEDYFDCVVVTAKGAAVRLSLGDTKGGIYYGRLVTAEGVNYFRLARKR